MLDRVIVTRNVVFDENILYEKERENTEGHRMEIAKEIVELLLEDEIQDAESIFENKGLWYESSLEQNEKEPELGGVEQSNQSSEEPKSMQVSHDSGVDSSEALLETGLMTPQSTPEPESMPELRSSGIEGTGLPNSPSTMEDDATERTGTVREVH